MRKFTHIDTLQQNISTKEASLTLEDFEVDINQFIDKPVEPTDKEKLLLVKLDSLQIDPNEDIKPPQSVWQQISETKTATLGTLGNFSVVTGKAKSRKSFLMGALASAALTSEYFGNIKGTLPDDKRQIIYIDTEMGRYHTQKAFKRILSLSNGHGYGNIRFFCFRSLEPNERLLAAELLIKNTSNLGLVIIDGIKDLINSINDESEASKIATKLLQWTEIYNIHIITVLHQNKADSNARGHVGTELINKAETVLSITKDEDATISVVEATQCRNIEPEPFGFEIIEGLPVFTNQLDNRQDNGRTGKGIKLDIDKLEVMIKDVFLRNEEYTYANLVTQTKLAFEDHFNQSIGINKVKEVLTRLANGNIIINEDKFWKLVN